MMPTAMRDRRPREPRPSSAAATGSPTPLSCPPARRAAASSCSTARARARRATATSRGRAARPGLAARRLRPARPRRERGRARSGARSTTWRAMAGAAARRRARSALRGSSMGGFLALLAAARRRRRAPWWRSARPSPSGCCAGCAPAASSFRADARGARGAARVAQRARDGGARSRPRLLLLHAEGDESVPVGPLARARRALAATRARGSIAVPGGHHRSVQHDAELQAVALRWIRKALAEA